MSKRHILVLGQILVDVTLPGDGRPIKLRAGGIIHAARALWAIGCPYSLGYCAPSYLSDEIGEHAKNYGAHEARSIGVVTGSPNVILIAEPKEAGPQGYDYLLRDSHRCELSDTGLAAALSSQPSDVLLFPGGFPLATVLAKLAQSTAAIHADANFDLPHAIADSGRMLDTLILSTSSEFFLKQYHGEPRRLSAGVLGKACTSLLLKENRGGARYFAGDGHTVSSRAQPRLVQHSVGVGDCFDAVFIALRGAVSDKAALAYSSVIAAEYAATTFPDVFRDAAQAWLDVPPDEICDLAGNEVPWEARPTLPVYVAGPDFEHVDRRSIDAAAECLRYHNFVPRLPIRENGQMGLNASEERRQTLCEADLLILDECRLMLAVLPYDDPGTLIEIGIAVERGIPVVVYDPHNRADNLMLTQLPHLVSPDLDAVVTAIFTCASRLLQASA